MNKLVIDVSTLVDVATGNAPVTSKLGYAFDSHNTSYVIFASTDKGSNTLRRDKNGNLILNIKKNNWQKDQKASHQAASQTQTLAQKLKSQQPVSGEVQVPTSAESDFSDVSAALNPDIPF